MREVFTAIKMSIITEASKLMFEEVWCQEGSKFENAIKTCSLKILESKSTLVRNYTPYMGATFESKKFNLLLETVFKIWSCSKCI